MGISFLTPLFLAGFLAISIPIAVHLIRRHQGRRLDFPSLMFLRQLPVKSVRRLRIRDWPLLLLRAGALALIVLAFARPVLQFGTPVEGIEGDGLREVVIVLDRSWSMTRGDRWNRALDEARVVLNGLVTPDRVSLVVFDGVGRVVIEPTLDPAQVRAVLDTIQAGWGSTQIGAGLQAAGGLLENSDRSRREVVLISDFQRRGWEDGPRDRLPPGTRLTPVDVGDDGLGTMIVAEVELEHSTVEGRQRVHPQARIVRQGETAPVRARVVLEMDGREIESRAVEFDSEGASIVTFEPYTVPSEGVRGSVRLEPEGAQPEEPFRFFFSPSEILSVLLIEGAVAARSPYLRNALSVTGGAPLRLQTRAGAAVGSTDLSGVDLVVLNDIPLPSGASGNLLREHVTQGGGLLVVAGPETAPAGWEGAWDAFLPGRPGSTVDRDPVRGGRLARVDRDHPIFAPYAGVEGAGLANPRFFRYRTIDVPREDPGGDRSGGVGVPGQSIHVIAGFDDGRPALVERSVGNGRVLVWTATMDTTWTDFPLHPVFVPVVREVARFASTRRESLPYFTVGQPLDARYLLGEPESIPGDVTDDGPSGAPQAPVGGILVGPGGTGVELRSGGGALVQLSTPGFYEVRAGDEAGPVERVVAVNPDSREADPSRVDPAEVVIAAAPGSGGVPDDEGSQVVAGSLALDGPDRGTLLQEGERRQGAWRFLLLGALLFLVSESLLAGWMKPLAKQGLDT